jgi:predicted ATP-grasp superfamily ATP-dependent carboligase
MQDLDGFAEDILAACQRFDPDAVIATGTNLTNSLSAVKQRIAPQVRAKLLVEDHDKLSRLADKWRTYELCRELGVPVPASALVTRENLEAVRSLRPPLVAKPRLAFASRGVEFLDDADQREAFLKRLLAEPASDGTYMAQESHPGELHDVTSCSKAGRPVSLLSQHRLMGLRDFGGGGVINQTTDVPEIREYAARIIGHLSVLLQAAQKKILVARLGDHARGGQGLLVDVDGLVGPDD